jgi:hypothetical protein
MSDDFLGFICLALLVALFFLEMSDHLLYLFFYVFRRGSTLVIIFYHALRAGYLCLKVGSKSFPILTM